MRLVAKHAQLLPNYDVTATLRGVVDKLAKGRTTISVNELRRGLFAQHLFPSERDLGAFWRRISVNHEEINFASFCRHLKPRLAGHCP